MLSQLCLEKKCYEDPNYNGGWWSWSKKIRKCNVLRVALYLNQLALGRETRALH